LQLAEPQDSDFMLAEVTAATLEECEGKRHVLICHVRARGGQEALQARTCEAVATTGRSGWTACAKDASPVRADTADDGIKHSNDVGPGEHEALEG
jgi:hypothetical protein